MNENIKKIWITIIISQLFSENFKINPFFYFYKFQVSYLYTPELFPTEVRGQGISFTTVTGSLGSMMAPIITDILVCKFYKLYYEINLQNNI